MPRYHLNVRYILMLKICLSDIQISLDVLYFIEERWGEGTIDIFPPPLPIRLGLVHAAGSLISLEEPALYIEMLN